MSPFLSRPFGAPSPRERVLTGAGNREHALEDGFPRRLRRLGMTEEVWRRVGGREISPFLSRPFGAPSPRERVLTGAGNREKALEDGFPRRLRRLGMTEEGLRRAGGREMSPFLSRPFGAPSPRERVLTGAGNKENVLEDGFPRRLRRLGMTEEGRWPAGDREMAVGGLAVFFWFCVGCAGRGASPGESNPYF